MTEDEKRTIVALAIGRIFRLGSRPAQPGDVEEYERARAAIYAALDPDPYLDQAPNWARDRLKGAKGD